MNSHSLPHGPAFASLPFSPAPAWRRAAQWFDQWLSHPLSARRAVVGLSLYLVLAANWPLWFAVVRLGGPPSTYLRVIAVLAALVACGMVALLSLTAWTRFMKPLWLAITLVAALSQYYMLTYHVVMDPGMAANVFQTDLHEVADLLGWRMVFSVLVVAALPAWWLARLRIPAMPVRRQLWRNGVLLLLALAGAGVLVAAFSRDLAPLMRNQPALRYMMNPLATLYSSSLAAVRPLRNTQHTLVPMTQGAMLGASYAGQARPMLYVVVLGETARSDHFSLNGYERATNPELSRQGVVSWSDVHSCGTSTLASVPCMFSPLGKRGYEARKNEYENLLDVVHAAGMGVLWIDNQSGCKGVCERVAHVSASDGLPQQARAALCPDGECRDEAMLQGLDRRLQALPAEQRQRGVLLVLHQMGSHGPAYSKRSSQPSKHFLPECRTEVLADCSHSELMNAYDNSIVETDAFLSHTIDWLKAQSVDYDTGMLYLSDHGESLGEYGLFLHGMPYALAPDVQKHVPMVGWWSLGLLQRAQLSSNCLRADADAPLTHDNLYHTVLGMLDVRSPTYQVALDAFAGCRGDALAARDSAVPARDKRVG
ncbi:MAG: phosphoethanolamine--lipid A transferase [Comamonadaceae bacterium]|nr:MAG: phosphoethanolamine--lipid A transferase [Comamonadaceae bacterium]